MDSDRQRQIDSQRRLLSDRLTQLQSTRMRLAVEGARIPSVETELHTVQDQIDFLQSEGRKDVFDSFASFERQRAWLDEQCKELSDLADWLEAEAGRLGQGPQSPALRDPTAMSPWLASVEQRVGAARQGAVAMLQQQADNLRDLERTIREEQGEQWQPLYENARKAYVALREETVARRRGPRRARKAASTTGGTRARDGFAAQYGPTAR